VGFSAYLTGSLRGDFWAFRASNERAVQTNERAVQANERVVQTNERAVRVLDALCEL